MRPVLFLLLTAVNAQYYLYYYSQGLRGQNKCCNSRLGCKNVPELDCCEAPPSPASFPEAYAYSDGPAGVLAFFTPTASGGCGGCASTNSLNVCYQNDEPFETLAIVAVGSYCEGGEVPEAATAVKRGMNTTRSEEMEAENAPAKAATCRKPDSARIDGVELDIAGVDLEMFTADMLAGMSVEAILAKHPKASKSLVTGLEKRGEPTC